MSLRTRTQAVAGALLLALVGGVLLLTGPPTHLGAVTVQLVLLSMAGVLMVLTGVGNPVRERVGVGGLTGLANVCLGVSFPLGVATDLETTGDYAFLALTLVGGLSLVFIGVEHVRGSGHFETPEP